MLQQVTETVRARLAAQVNSPVSLVYGEYHILSSLLLLLRLLIIYDKAHLTHLW